MNQPTDNAGAWAMLTGLGIFAIVPIIIVIVWTLFPFIMWVKFNAVLRQLHAIRWLTSEHNKHTLPQRPPSVQKRSWPWLFSCIAVLAVINIAPCAHATIGMTRSQIMKNFGSKSLVGDDGSTMTFHSRNIAKIVFGDSERSELEYYYIATPYDLKSLLDTVNKAIGRRLHFNKVPNRLCWTSDDGNFAAALLNDAPSGYRWGVAVGLTDVVTRTLVWHDQPTRTAPVAPLAPAPHKAADCSIVASETFDRLKGKSAWVAIVDSLIVYADGSSNGHAMAVWKDEPTSHVKIYVSDELGTLTLNTSSEHIEDIENAFNAAIARAGSRDYFKNFRFSQEPVTTKGMTVAQP